VAKRIARLYGARVYKVPMLSLLEEAGRLAGPGASGNTVFDYAHVLAARRLHVHVFVTADLCPTRE
jgi:hypothetical protein